MEQRGCFTSSAWSLFCILDLALPPCCSWCQNMELASPHCKPTMINPTLTDPCHTPSHLASLLVSPAVTGNCQLIIVPTAHTGTGVADLSSPCLVRRGLLAPKLCLQTGTRVSVEMREAAGPLPASDSEGLAEGCLLTPSLETAEDLGDFAQLLCNIGRLESSFGSVQGRGLSPFHCFPVRCWDRGIISSCFAKSAGGILRRSFSKDAAEQEEWG